MPDRENIAEDDNREAIIQSSRPSSSLSQAENSDIEPFLPVINAINLEALAVKALHVRSSIGSFQLCPLLTDQSQPLTCSIRTPPWTGSYSMAYEIDFSDGIKWIARVPGRGLDAWGPLEIRRFVTDIHTISWIRASTSIPIPEVYSFETSACNPVKVPYRLEAFVEGKPLAERWSDSSWPTEEKRLKVLRNLASIISTLHPFKFDKIGGLNFGSQGGLSHVGERVHLEEDFYKIMAGEEVWGTARVQPPETSITASLAQEFQEADIPPEHLKRLGPEYALLRLAVESIPEFLHSNGVFVLGHPDFNFQNIFVDDGGNITGIIDWDGTYTYARSLGFAGYPSWITRDWDPVKYAYGDEDDQGEDSPEQLLSYRKEYARAFEDLRLSPRYYSIQDTQLSQIMEAVAIASGDEISRPWILVKLLQWAFNDRLPFELPNSDDGSSRDDDCMPHEWKEFNREFYRLYNVGEADEWIAAIKIAFEQMWRPEW